jgi:hypothetical protein
MAKDKTDELTAQLEKATEAVTNGQIALEAALQRQQALEDWIATVLTELHTVKVNCQIHHGPLSKRCGSHYVTGRDLLGQRGLEVDKALRG